MAGKNVRSGILAGAALATLSVMGSAGRAQAATQTLFSTGFEPASDGTTSFGYVSGNFLSGEPSGVGATSVKFAGLGGFGTAGVGSAVISTYTSPAFTLVPGNTQYVTVSDNSGLPSGAAETYTPNLSAYNPIANGFGSVDIVGTMSITAGGTNDAAFGLLAYGATGSVVADFLVDASTGKVTVNDALPTSPTTTSTTISPLGYSNFASYELHLNYAAQTYSVYVTTPGGSFGPSDLVIGNVPFEAADSSFLSGGIWTASLASTGNSTGGALVDNLSITAVPEPTTASLVVGGLAALAGTRRRRRTSAK